MIAVCMDDCNSDSAPQDRTKSCHPLAGIGTQNTTRRSALFWGLMLNPEECRKLAEQYRARTNDGRSAPRLVNVLLSVSNAYLALAGQLELLASVERQGSARMAGRDYALKATSQHR